MCSCPVVTNNRHSVYYQFPKSQHVHKSMLLAGVKFDPQALDMNDIDNTRNRARTSGRSFGGAPLRNGSNGHGGGRGRIDYSESRPNPFAGHLQPGFVPPPHIANRDGYGRPAYQQQPYQQPFPQTYPPPVPPNYSSYHPPSQSQNYGSANHPPPPPRNYGAPNHAPPSHSRGNDRPERALPEGYGYNRSSQHNGYGNRYEH